MFKDEDVVMCKVSELPTYALFSISPHGELKTITDNVDKESNQYFFTGFENPRNHGWIDGNKNVFYRG